MELLAFLGLLLMEKLNPGDMKKNAIPLKWNSLSNFAKEKFP